MALLGAAVLLPAQRRLTEQEAVALALQNHPAMAAAEGQLRQQQLIGASAPAWDPAQFFHNVTADPDLGLLGTTTVGVQQNFPSGRQIKAARSVYAGRQQEAQARLDLERLSVGRQVRDLYHHISYLQARQALYLRLDSVYQRVALAAENRHRLGDAPLAESLALRDKARQVALEYQTIGHEIEFDHYVLAQLLGSAEPVVPIVEPLHEGSFSLADTSRLAYSATALLAQSQTALAQAELAVANARFAPVASAGVYGQYLGDGQVFPGWQLGLNVPLFRKSLNTQAEAAQVGVAVAGANRQHLLLAQRTELGHLLHQQEKFQLLIGYYHQQGQALAAELIRSGELNYRQGEAGYTELVQLLEQAAQIELNYLDHLLGLNQTIIALEALSGQ